MDPQTTLIPTKPPTGEREKKEQKQRSERGERGAIIDFYEEGGNKKRNFMFTSVL